jgi:hypothetical protein
MAVIGRVLGVSLATGVVVGMGLALFLAVARGGDPWSEYALIILFFASVGAVIGAIAGAAREVAPARRAKAVPWVDLD